MVPGTAHRSPGIYLMTEKNPGKPQLGDRLIKSIRSVIASNELPYLQMTLVGSYNRSGKVREGKKETQKERKKERKRETMTKRLSGNKENKK